MIPVAAPQTRLVPASPLPRTRRSLGQLSHATRFLEYHGEARGDLYYTKPMLLAIGDLSADEIDAYVASGEPLGKAGAYAIQGRAAAFIAHISGSYSGIMGLPMFETAQLLRQVGVKV